MTPEQKAKPLPGSLLLFLILGAFLFFAGRVVYEKIIELYYLSDPPSWNGLVPGQSSMEDAIQMLGLPNQSEKIKEPEPFLGEPLEYWIYTYEDIVDPESGKRILLELWTDGPLTSQIIAAIYVSYYDHNTPRDLPYLSGLITDHNDPEYVSWSYHCWSRYLFWPRQGMMADSNFSEVTEYLSEPWEKSRILYKFLFVPTAYSQYQRRFWLSAQHPVAKNQCEGRDEYPENPFNWEQILSAGSPTPVP